MDPILLQKPPSNFETKKWALFLTCLVSLYLWYQVFQANVLDYYPYNSSSTDDEDSKAKKRFSRIFLFFVSSAGIIGQMLGLVACMKAYRCCLNAHVWINMSLAALFVIGLVGMFFTDPSSLRDIFSGFWGAAIIFTWIGNIVLGILYRRDVRWMHKQKKLAQCNCLDLRTVEQQMAHARAHSIPAMNPAGVPVGVAAVPPPPLPPPQYIYGPDGSRYIVSRPSLRPPTPPPPPKDSNDWLMMNMMLVDSIL